MKFWLQSKIVGMTSKMCALQRAFSDTSKLSSCSLSGHQSSIHSLGDPSCTRAFGMECLVTSRKIHICITPSCGARAINVSPRSPLLESRSVVIITGIDAIPKVVSVPAQFCSNPHGALILTLWWQRSDVKNFGLIKSCKN